MRVPRHSNNDTQHKDTHHNGLNCAIQHNETQHKRWVSLCSVSHFLIVMLNVFMLSVVMLRVIVLNVIMLSLEVQLCNFYVMKKRLIMKH
jgi:hypothetical protein